MATSNDFVPRREPDLDAFVHNFDDRITDVGTSVGISSIQSAAFHTLVVAWDAAYAVTKNVATRCASAVIVKDDKKHYLVQNLRELARIVQAFPGTTDEMRSLLGLTVPTQRQTHPAPAFAPKLDIMKVTGNIVSLQLRDPQNISRLRPAFAKSANIFSYVGENPPTNSADGWFFQGGTTRSRIEVVFDPSIPMGTTVYLTAFWKNERDLSGPACQPVAVTLLGGAMLPGSMRKGEGEPLSIAA